MNNVVPFPKPTNKQAYLNALWSEQEELIALKQYVGKRLIGIEQELMLIDKESGRV